MNHERWLERLGQLREERLPLPGRGRTPERHRRLIEVAREDVSLAKMAEAHWDALAILAEAGREPVPGALYGVWASEVPGKALVVDEDTSSVTGTKPFCSGAGLVNRVLVTAGELLVEVDMDAGATSVAIDPSGWHTEAFGWTRTGTVAFNRTPLASDAIVGRANWYVTRAGFWQGACGPAACWAGGAIGLLGYARASRREDPHTLAHLGALHAADWGMRTYLDEAGREIDGSPLDRVAAERLALQVRHLVEQLCAGMLRGFGRAYGPHPLCMDAETARRYAEVELYIRQSHAERDLESLGRLLRNG